MDISGCNLTVDRHCVDPGNDETCPSFVYCGTSYNRICTDGSAFTSSCPDVYANFSASMLKQCKMNQIRMVKIFDVTFVVTISLSSYVDTVCHRCFGLHYKSNQDRTGGKHHSVWNQS